MKTIQFILIIFFSVFVSNAQKKSKEVKIADKYFKDYAYYQATELYLDVLKEGDTTDHVLSRLGDCYYNNSNVQLASFWYKKAVTKYDDINTEYVYKYVQTLRSLNQYEEAKKWTKIFKERTQNDKRVKDEDIFDIEKFEALENTERVYVNFENLDTNTEYSDFGGFVKDSTFYFASSRVSDTIIDPEDLYKWNKEPFLDIYQARIETVDGSKVISDPNAITAGGINSPLHEASVTISNDGKTIYFTRDNITSKNKAAYDKDGTSNLRIFRATLKNDRWTNITDLPFNSEEFSNGSPALSPDNKTLYFVSDRPESIGQTDLFKVNIKSDGTYSNPINLGREINTEGRENFPYIAKDSTLYFSSDANINLGLLDIFESNILKRKKNDTTQVYVKNLGAPYNSGYDDFAFYINSDTNTGFFSSNREGGKGGDDIYSFGKYDCVQTIKGITKNKKTQKPLGKVVVKLIDEAGKIVEMVTTGKDGFFEFKDVPCESTFTVLGERVIYRPDQKDVTTTEINGEETEVELFLTPLIQDGEIVINPIYFDYNKSDIRPDAAYELENIVIVMREHPNMVIKIQSHTDSRGRNAYNKKLSDRRAKSTRDYLITQRNIQSPRIESAIGFGESQLLNHCKDGVKCSEEEHQLNRRSKFIILSGLNEGYVEGE